MGHLFLSQAWIGFAVSALFLAGCGSLFPTPTSTPTSTATPTVTPTSTATPTHTPAPTDTPRPTETPTITPTPSPYDGDWSGQTSEGLPVTFRVYQQVVSDMRITCQVELNLPGFIATTEISAPESYRPFVDGKFGSENIAMTLIGVFHSTTSASGTLTFKPDLSLCKLTTIHWNATKQ